MCSDPSINKACSELGHHRPAHPGRGVAFKAYSVIDNFSRKLVGCRVEEREVNDLAVEMFQDAFGRHGIPDAVHAYSGPAMRSGALKDLLGDVGVTQTPVTPTS